MVQSKQETISIVLTGQTLLQSDPRSLTPEAVVRAASMLSGMSFFPTLKPPFAKLEMM